MGVFQEDVLKIHKQLTLYMCNIDDYSININTCIIPGNFKPSTRTIVLRQLYNGSQTVLNDIRR